MTQKAKVIKRLQEFGEIENLWAVENYMLRLGAIIHQLRKEGWEIDGNFIEGTKNWKYTLRKQPQKMVGVKIVERDGQRIAVPQYA